MTFGKRTYHYPRLVGFLLCQTCGRRWPETGTVKAGLKTQERAMFHLFDHNCDEIHFHCRDAAIPGTELKHGWTMRHPDKENDP